VQQSVPLRREEVRQERIDTDTDGLRG